MIDRDADKRLAASAAVREICDDMLVGLGTGSTAAHATHTTRHATTAGGTVLRSSEQKE